MPRAPQYQQQIQQQERTFVPEVLAPVKKVDPLAVANAITRPLDAAIDIASENEQKAASNKHFEIESQLSSVSADLIRKAKDIHGPDADLAVDELMDEYKKKANELSSGLNGTILADAVHRSTVSNAATLQNALLNHAEEEAEATKKAAFDGLLASSHDIVSMIPKDPFEVLNQFDRVTAATADRLSQEGLKPDDPRTKDAYEASMRDAQAKLVVTAVEGALRENMPDLATAYAKKWDPNLDEGSREKIAILMRQHAQTAADDAYKQAAAAVDSNPGVHPKYSAKAMWDKLEPAQQEALMRRAEAPTMNDGDAWLDLWYMKPEELAKMSRSEFETKYWSKLDSEHRGRAERLLKDSQDAMGAGGGPGSLKYTSVISPKQRLLNTLKNNAIIGQKTVDKLKPKEKDLLESMEREFDEQLREFEYTKKSKATPEEQQQVIDQILRPFVKVVIDKAGFDKTTTLADVTPEQSKSAYIPIRGIPDADLADIRATLKQRLKKDPSERQIERAYFYMRSGDKVGYRSILEGK